MKHVEKLFDSMEWPDTGTRTYCEYQRVKIEDLTVLKYTGVKKTAEYGEPRPENCSPFVLQARELPNDRQWYVNEHDGTWIQGPLLERADPEIIRGAFVAKQEWDQKLKLKQLNAKYPASVRDRWAHQIPEARLVLSGQDSPLFTAMAKANGKDAHDMASDMYDQYTEYMTECGHVQGTAVIPVEDMLDKSLSELLAQFDMSVTDFIHYSNRS